MCVLVPSTSGVRLDAEAEQWARESFEKFAEERRSKEDVGTSRSMKVLRNHGLRCAMASVLGHVPTEVRTHNTTNSHTHTQHNADGLSVSLSFASSV